MTLWELPKANISYRGFYLVAFLFSCRSFVALGFGRRRSVPCSACRCACSVVGCVACGSWLLLCSLSPSRSLPRWAWLCLVCVAWFVCACWLALRSCFRFARCPSFVLCLGCSSCCRSSSFWRCLLCLVLGFSSTDRIIIYC